MTEREYNRIVSRQRRLPDMLSSARRKVAALESEARRYGMVELLPCANSGAPASREGVGV